MPDVTIAGATYEDVPAVTLRTTSSTDATYYYPDGILYAASPESGGNANVTNGILFGRCDSTSTATAFTATVEGLTELVDGTCVMLENGVVTSASGFTIDVNGLGAKPVYSNMAAAARDTTIFNVAYTMLFVYDEQRVSGGCWICYRGYDSNTNTIGYQLRTNSGNLAASDKGYRYRLWLTSADGSMWVPINTSTSTDATTARSLNTRAIDPFGPIVYNSTNGTTNAAARPAVGTLWQQYTLTIGYSYVVTMTAWLPVYLKCTPQSDGSAVMADVVQALPTSKDGYIYIALGMAYSATAMELRTEHPVYWHDGTGIRLWTGAETGGGSTVTVTQTLTSGTEIASVSVDGTSTTLYAPTPPTVPSASSTTPSMDGTAAVGTATTYARADHVHPTDTSRQATLVSGTNIKTINGNSLLGSGDLTVGGSVSMEDTAVDAAVEAAWSVVLHTITRQGSAADNSICTYIGLADPTSLGTYITEAENDATVYVATGGDYALDTPTPNTLVRSGYIGSYWMRVYSFVMPDSDVTVSVFYDD